MSTSDGRYHLVFNGEIYNYCELLEEQLRSGDGTTGTSDTEVLLHLLARHGAGALPMLNGMFALAFVDTADRTFLLARDRMGKKPLHVWSRVGHLRFASELKGLLAWPDAPRELDAQSAVAYLMHGYLPHGRSVLRDYVKVPPGHYVQGRLDAPERATTHPYWSLEINADRGRGRSAEVDLDELVELLRDAVRIRLRSDVPLGIFLSSGLDSGLISMLVAELCGDDRPLALTVGFDETEYDEAATARVVADAAGLPHLVVRGEPPGLEDLDRLTWFFDEPFADPSALPTMALCAAASQYATVFLSGDGGDEAFAGYRRYMEARRNAWAEVLPGSLRSAAAAVAARLDPGSVLRYRLAKVALPDSGYAGQFDGISTDPLFDLVAGPALRPHLSAARTEVRRRWAQTSGQDLTARQQTQDYETYLPDDILVKVDRASMAHSIEVRSPLLDHRVVEWAARLPRNVLLTRSQGKLPLRRIAGGLLPSAAVGLPKRGFGVPLDEWFRTAAAAELLQDRLLSRVARDRGLWDTTAVQRLIAGHQAGHGRPVGVLLWRLLVLDSWARWYYDGRRFAQGPPPTASRA